MNLFAGIFEFFLVIFYIKNPFRVLSTYLQGHSCAVVLRHGSSIIVHRFQRPLGVLVRILERGWKIQTLSSNDLLFTKDGISLVQPHFGILSEDIEHDYISGYSLAGHNVLDVGGFLGETAIMFKKKGHAQHVYVYEPIAENVAYLTKNIALNRATKHIHIIPYGVGKKNGTQTISSQQLPGDPGFGYKHGAHTVIIRLKSWETVLKHAVQHNVTFAKVDCEGHEKYLTTVSDGLIQKIPSWIIEIHSAEIIKALLTKFESCGYSFRKVSSMTYYFWK